MKGVYILACEERRGKGDRLGGLKREKNEKEEREGNIEMGCSRKVGAREREERSVCNFFYILIPRSIYPFGSKTRFRFNRFLLSLLTRHSH